MLTLTNIGAGQQAAEYYCQYCTDKGETQGIWIGKGTEGPGLDLVGKEISKEQMERILTGFSPTDPDEALCKNAGDNHRGGWDLTWAPDKSVSVVWASAAEDLRREIEEAHNDAVEAGIEFLQEHAAWTRTGDGGENRERADLVFARFQHSTNRAAEPHLHSHTVLFNVARTRSDGKWRTLEVRDIYRKQLVAGAIYKVQMAARLQQLGFEIRPTKDSFEIVGVPKSVCEQQSSRSRAIDEKLHELGLSREEASAKAREIAALATRKVKTDSRPDFARWCEENATHGFNQMAIAKLRQSEAPRLSESGRNEIISTTVGALTAERSTFEEHQLIGKMARECIGKTDVTELYMLVNESMTRGNVFALGHLDDRAHYTTAEMFATERELLRITEARALETHHQLTLGTVESTLSHHAARLAARGHEMNPEQIETLKRVTLDGRGASFITGVAGAGKTFTSRMIKDSFAAEGYQSFGIAPTNKAAQELRKDLEIDTSSIHRFLAQAVSGELKLDQKTVVFVDESAMVDSRKMLLLNTVLAKSGSKVVYLGDHHQIQPIGAGQSFKTQTDRVGSSTLRAVMRQKDKAEANAILEVRNGNSSACIEYLNTNDRLNIAQTRGEMLHDVLTKWKDYKSESPDNTCLIVASKNNTVDRINSMAHEALKSSGILTNGLMFETTSGKTEVCIGERLLMTGNLRRAGLTRSQLVTVTELKNNLITVRTDDGRVTSFKPKEFNRFKHGYAITANRSQGSTVDRAFVVVDGSFMDRERCYVALSRGRDKNEIFADKTTLGDLSDHEKSRVQVLVESGGDSTKIHDQIYREKLSTMVNRSGMKNTTQDFHEAATIELKTDLTHEALSNSWAELERSLSRASQDQAQSQTENSRFDHGNSLRI